MPNIVRLPVLQDNFIFLIDLGHHKAAVVDPAVAQPVLEYCDNHKLELIAILNTHHHPDHTGGNLELVRETGCEVYGSKLDPERIPGIDWQVGEGDRITLEGSTFQVLETPGHTRGHIAYWLKADNALFCGDTLFSLGCGRLFEGSPEQMWTSLQKLRKLPRNTRIFCAHEYTLQNARFALTIDPDNQYLRQYAAKVKKQRDQGEYTIPTLLSDEIEANPFLRADHATLMAKAKTTHPVEAFAFIRRQKDHF